MGKRHEGEHVSSGSFRLETGRAIEKLRHFRDPKAGPLVFWIRCATACGPARLEIAERDRTLTLAFDGAPLPRAALADPLAALFTSAASEAELQFARGVMHAWPAASSFEATSGPPGDRWTLRALAPDDRKLSRAEGGAGTELRITINDPELLWSHPRPLETVACRPRSHLWTPYPILFKEGGAALRRYERARPSFGELEFGSPGLPGKLSIPPAGAERLAVDVHYLGVFVDAVVQPLAPIPAVGKLDARELQLDLTQASLVHTDRLAGLRTTIEAQAEELLLKVCEDLVKRMPETARILRGSRYARRLWRQAFAPAAKRSRPKDGPWSKLLRALRLRPSSEDLQLVLDDAEACRWISEAAEKSLKRRLFLGSAGEVGNTRDVASAYGSEIGRLIR